MSTAGKVICAIVSILLVGVIIFFGFIPVGRKLLNLYDHSLQKADEVQYEVKKEVEDTERAMIAFSKIRFL